MLEDWVLVAGGDSAGNFSLHHRVLTGCVGFTQPPMQWVRRGCDPRGKAAGA
jgi:hypothetical protein